jgi:hypothetical protein
MARFAISANILGGATNAGRGSAVTHDEELPALKRISRYWIVEASGRHMERVNLLTWTNVQTVLQALHTT